eukprot:s2758_g1.t2
MAAAVAGQITCGKSWVLHYHLELRREELKLDEAPGLFSTAALRGLLWRDLDFLKNVWEELVQLPDQVPAAPGEMAMVPSENGATTACLATVPTVLGCKVPSFNEASPAVALPYGEDGMVSRAGDGSCPLGTFILPPLAEMLCAFSAMKNVFRALPARSLHWFQENVSMCAVSGQIVPLNALVAESLLRNLPKVPDNLEVVPVPRKMEDLAATLGICVRPDVDMCWLILRSLCDAGVRTVGPYVENLAMLQSLRCTDGSAASSDPPSDMENQAILFLPSSTNSEPSFAALSEIYVTQELGTKTMPKDEEEAGRAGRTGRESRAPEVEMLRDPSCQVISCASPTVSTHNVAYWSFASELKLMGCAERPSVAEALQALQRAAQEPSFRQRIGPSSVKDRGELLNDHGLEVMLSLYRLLELALSAVEDVPSWDWKERWHPGDPERLTPTRVMQTGATLTAACSMHGPLPIVTWEGRLVTGCSEVWACRSSWFLDSVLDAAPICFIHRDIAEHCPRLELTEVSEVFSEVLGRKIQVVSCNWIALELFFSPKVEPKETDATPKEWFSDVPGLIKERLRAQPSFAMIGGVLVLATHFVKEAAERAALAAAALALALQEMGKTRQDAEDRGTWGYMVQNMGPGTQPLSPEEKIRSFTSERFWEGSSSQSHAGFNIRQVRSTEVLLPSGIGEEATLPGLMGSFGAVEQYEDDEEATTVRLRGFPGDHRRDHELFADALGRILSDHGTVSYRRTPAPANAMEILAVKESGMIPLDVGCWQEQQKRVGERAEHFYSCFLESVFGDAYKPTRDWVSSARSCVYPGRGTDDACGFDFVVLDTAQRIDDPQLLRLEADSFLARVDPAAGRPVAGRAAASPVAAPAAKPVAKAAAKTETQVATVNIPAATVGLVIGKGGATVKWMSQESGAQIQVVDGNTPGLANLKIEGSKAQIQHAKQLIQEVVYSRQWDTRSGRVWKGNSSNGSDVETADQVDIEWTDYEKRRYNKYKIHNFMRVLRAKEKNQKDVVVFLQIPEPQLEKLQDLWPPIRDSFKRGNMTFALPKNDTTTESK